MKNSNMSFGSFWAIFDCHRFGFGVFLYQFRSGSSLDAAESSADVGEDVVDVAFGGNL